MELRQAANQKKVAEAAKAAKEQRLGNIERMQEKMQQAKENRRAQKEKLDSRSFSKYNKLMSRTDQRNLDQA